MEVIERQDSHTDAFSEEILGSITFDPLRIEILSQPETPQRQRFTLAHELSHHLLQHEKYLRREICQESDFCLEGGSWSQDSEVGRLEWQANYHASCLLLPRKQFLHAFSVVTAELGIVNKGFGPLFVDSQPCNVRNLYSVLRRLGAQFEVSRSVVRIRLEELRLLTYGSRPVRIAELLRDVWG